MTQGTHYEEAFAAALSRHGIAYTSLNQQEKALKAGVLLKSFDYIIYPQEGRRLLVDVKGRKISRRAYEHQRLEQTWATRDDIASLEQWEALFGSDYAAILVFAYWLTGQEEPLLPFHEEVEHFQGRDYSFWLIGLRDYQREMRPRSRRWGTVYVPLRRFVQLAKPMKGYCW